MTLLFDMIASSSTGSILVAALVAPDLKDKTQPRYYSDTVLNLFKNSGQDIFKINTVSYWFYIASADILAGLSGWWHFYFGKRHFDNPEKDKAYQILRDIFKQSKKKTKHKNTGTAEDNAF